MRRLRSIHWRDGFGEYLGFALVIPLVFIFVFFMISTFQVTVAEEKLIYASYRAGRAAITADNEASARKNAQAVLEEIYHGNLSADANNLAPGMAAFQIEKASWIKGNIVKVSVSQHVDTMLPGMSTIHKRCLGLMIEHSTWYDN